MGNQKTVGIIAEYDPFHNGHIYHLNEAKQMTNADMSVIVMSGNFVQRGRPALLDKWERASLAVNAGADIVFELPFVFACNNAGAFAKGAVQILKSLGCVDFLAFGSENGNVSAISEAANIIGKESDELKKRIKEELGKGKSFPAARYEALKPDFPQAAEVLLNSNDILAAEYIREIQRTRAGIEPVAILRKSTSYNDSELHNGMSSATAIRQAMSNGDLSGIKSSVPEDTFRILSGDTYSEMNDKKLFDFVRLAVLSKTSEELSECYSVGEGLENRIRREVMNAKDYDELIDRIKSKRYTETRIRRMLIHIIVGFTKKDWKLVESESDCYARVLGFSPKGASLLRQIKDEKSDATHIITNINKEMIEDERLQKIISIDLKSSDIYNLLRGRDLYKHSDRTQKPYIGTLKSEPRKPDNRV